MMLCLWNRRMFKYNKLFCYWGNCIKKWRLPLRAKCKGTFCPLLGCTPQEGTSARPWHLLISSSGLQPFLPHRFVSLYEGIALLYSLPYRPLPSTPCDSCSACLLPTVHPGNTPYTKRPYLLTLAKLKLPLDLNYKRLFLSPLFLLSSTFPFSQRYTSSSSCC